MITEFGQFTALCLLVATILKLIDWLMLDEQKQALRGEIRERLNRSQASFVFVAKTPILALDKILSTALNDPQTERASRRRKVTVSSLLIVASLVGTGIFTDSILGFKDSPSAAYRQQIQIFETIIARKAVTDDAAPEEKRELNQFRQDMTRILETAKHPFTRWASLAFVVTLMGIISVTFTNFSLSFAAKTVKAITTTDQLILLAGAILLNGFGSLLIFIIEIMALSLASSVLLLLVFSLFGLLLELGPGWGLAALSGYGAFAWITAPFWLKALAIASIIPFLLIVVAIMVSAIIFPIRKPFFVFLDLLFQRLATHREGPVAFLATAFFCLAAAITAATRLIS